jgi:hypothetical protein
LWMRSQGHGPTGPWQATKVGTQVEPQRLNRYEPVVEIRFVSGYAAAIRIRIRLQAYRKYCAVIAPSGAEFA